MENVKTYAVILDAMSSGEVVSPVELRKKMLEANQNPRYLPLYLSRARQDGAVIEAVKEEGNKRKVAGYRLKVRPSQEVRIVSGRPAKTFELRRVIMRGERGRFLPMVEVAKRLVGEATA